MIYLVVIIRVNFQNGSGEVEEVILTTMDGDEAAECCKNELEQRGVIHSDECFTGPAIFSVDLLDREVSFLTPPCLD